MRANLTTRISTALLLVAAAACQDPMAPVEEPGVRPVPELRRNASVVLRRIDIEGACDGKDLFGDARKGQFSYRIGVEENNVSGNGDTHIKQSEDYGRALGQTFLRGPGQNIDLNDHTYGFTGLSSGESVTVSLAAIEWDLFDKDSDMVGSTTMQRKAYPGKDGTEYYELNLGSGSCKVELEYAIVWVTP